MAHKGLVLLSGVLLGLAARADDSVVFRSGVSLVRVDAQVVDRGNRVITGLGPQDFLLREQGTPQPIQGVDNEKLPIDLVLLLDVSASMRPHVERIVSASHESMHQLRDQDRVAIMVFDRSTRVRMGFRSSQSGVDRELENALDYETFRGGTDITLGLLDAAEMIRSQGRREARKAIVIVTDDQTERERNVEAVERALARSDAVLMALIAPDAMGTGGMRRDRRGYPGGSGPGGSLGGIIFGSPRRGYPGGGGPMAAHTQSAGTEEIARASGGDSLPVTDAYALQDTLARIRQTYAVYFSVPPGVRAGDEREITLALADAAYRRYPGADVRYRHHYYAPVSADPSEPASSEPRAESHSGPNLDDPDRPHLQRRPGVSPVPDSSREGPLNPDGGSSPAPAATAHQASPPSVAPTPPWRADPDAPGWRKARPDELSPK